MSDAYEHLEHIKGNQRQAWLIDTEPPEGKPDNKSIIRTNDALEVAFNMLTRILRRIALSNKYTYTPNCRWHLREETAGIHPLGGDLDLSNLQLSDPQTLTEAILEDFRLLTGIGDEQDLENDFRYWKDTEFLNDDDVAAESGISDPRKFSPEIGDVPPLRLSPATPTDPWWEFRPNTQNPDPKTTPTKPQRLHFYPPEQTPQQNPQGTGSGGLGAIIITDLLLRSLSELDAYGEETQPQDEPMAQRLRVKTERAAKIRKQKEACRIAAITDIHLARNWIKQVTEPNTKEQKKHHWGYKTTDTAPRHTRKFSSRK